MQYSPEEVKYYMEEVRKKIVAYLEDEVEINLAALKGFDERTPEQMPPIKEEGSSRSVYDISSQEAELLRRDIHQLKRYIAVIKRMIV